MTKVGIIGSGLTAVTVAKKLIERGCRPIILDVGETLDPDRQRIVERLAQQSTFNWDADDLSVIMRNPTLFDRKIPMRLAFGSDYVYAYNRDKAPYEVWEDGPSATFARGGFSNVWGAAMLPADDCDMGGWPIRQSNLAPYYRQVLKNIPLSATQSRLTRRFPLFKSDLNAIELAPLEQAFLNNLEKSRHINGREDILYGQARIAVRANSATKDARCAYCGLCMSGCVYESIYTASQELTRLERTGLVDYRPGRLVRNLEEHQNKVSVICVKTGGELEKVFFDRVFVAAGAFSSTRIVLESKRLFNRSVVMKTAYGFFAPMIRLRGAPFNWPKTKTLAGIFLEFKIPEISNHWIHTQISTANELVLAKLGFDMHRNCWKDKMLQPVFNRLLIALCNFHSDHSGAYALTLRPAADGGPSTLVVEPKKSDTFSQATKSGARRLFQLMAREGVLVLLSFLATNNEKFRAGHFGGTLPMSSYPQNELDTDILGRPMGWTRIHVVDSSVFPSIPGTTIALLTMANAQRIADTAPLD